MRQAIVRGGPPAAQRPCSGAFPRCSEPHHSLPGTRRPCAKLARMSERARPSRLGRRTLWAAATGFWLFVAVMSAAQILWIAQMPGQRVDMRGAMAWQSAYFVAWIPFTIAVWHVTRGWLPERFGGWLRLLLAHLPVFAGVALAHPFLVTLLALALGNQTMPLWERFLMQLRGQLNAQLLIYTAIVGTGAALTLHERYQDRQVAAARLQAELTAARLEALRGHLQPHF